MHLRNKFDLQKSEGKIKKGVSVNPEIHEAGCPGVFLGGFGNRRAENHAELVNNMR